jgi:hypothetical protein
LTLWMAWLEGRVKPVLNPGALAWVNNW